ncbi:MAG: aldolase/citrate lyase family protein [Boseongicola sp.]|nr:aldolase/citrate lyase family protein [Boseongicola sp.]MDE0345123.1 aldolase/citrate lyase family protein [Boseongicola sp.]
MKLERNRFTHAIAAGEKQVGIWITLGSNLAAEVVAPSGYDWALIDTEHSPGDYFSVLGQLQAFAPYDTTPIVRVEWNDPVAVKRMLDIGAPGLLFPMIQSAAEARQAVASTRYPPRGMRGVAGSTRATKYGRVTNYVQRVEAETTVLLQLETRAAMEQAAEIAQIDGVSGIFFGPADIAADIGKVGQPMAAEVWELIRAAAGAVRESGKPAGTLVLDAQLAAELLNEGFTFVACGTDTSVLARGADGLLAAVKDGIDRPRRMQ